MWEKDMETKADALEQSFGAVEGMGVPMARPMLSGAREGGLGGAVFEGFLRSGTGGTLQIRVPVDDNNTMYYFYNAHRTGELYFIAQSTRQTHFYNDLACFFRNYCYC